MQFSVTFRKMDPSDAIREHAYERIQRLQKYLTDPITANVVLDVERYRHKVDVNIVLHNGLLLKAEEATDDMYKSIDRAVEKLERQVRRYKDRIRRHKPRTGPEVSIRHNVLAAPEPEQSGIEEEELAVPEVVRTSEFTARPLTIEEAIMQLDLESRAFLVFTNAETKAVNVVYRREDGNYGLIETPSVVI